MRSQLSIIITVVVVLGVLIAINSATYVSEEEHRDTELSANRSTYHAGPTGTRALYDFLSESGYKVMRWREIPEKLLSDGGQQVQTFVIIGDTPLTIDREQAEGLLLWVERGGRLIIVDRRPHLSVLPPSGKWTVTSEMGDFPSPAVDPANSDEMTKDVLPAQPVQPTLLTRDIDSVMPSRFASTLRFAAVDQKRDAQLAEAGELLTGEDSEDEAPPDGGPTTSPAVSDTSVTASPAPVVHASNAKGALLLDYPHGKGRIVLLSDPYIFSNGGIKLKDNLQLAINILAGAGGLIAFDEYHQGRGSTRNALIGYFAGTPVMAIAGQIVFLILLVLWTRSRRFARPLPLKEIDRRSSLEFVASMSELQQRARAYDLAIENIYSRTRRVLARYAGMEYNRPRSEIAARVAGRSTLDAHGLETLMRQCEAAINGGPITERQTIHLVKRLREVERSLGLRMRSREVKQAAQKS
jgi:uncharacterized protein DUF4350